MLFYIHNPPTEIGDEKKLLEQLFSCGLDMNSQKALGGIIHQLKLDIVEMREHFYYVLFRLIKDKENRRFSFTRHDVSV